MYISSISGVPNALVRWKEESSVLDGDSVHDCVTAIKPAILEVQGRAGQGGQGRTGQDRKPGILEMGIPPSHDFVHAFTF